MNFMIWSIGLMYVYWMVIRDMMIPIAYSELVDKNLREQLVKTSMTQSSVLGLFTFITALLFLAMYYYFAETTQVEEEVPKPEKNKTKRESMLIAPENGSGIPSKNTKRTSASI